MLKANKGEWAEFYAFLKILQDQKIHASNEKLEIIKDKYFKFLKIIRQNKNEKTLIYDLQDSQIIILDNEKNILKHLPTSLIKSKTKSIFTKIKSRSRGTFEITEAEQLLKELLCDQIKANNTKKADIDAIIEDRIANRDDHLGFSVKSMAGSASTLLNASQATNFIYEVKGLTIEDLKKINLIETKNKVKERIHAIEKLGGKIKFSHLKSSVFESNLQLIDTFFSKFVSHILLDYYRGNATNIEDLVKLLSKNTKFKENYNLKNFAYAFKFKNFLISVALGLVPNKPWDGYTKASGGYIIVKEDGDLVCYNLYNRDEFLVYLYKNTKLETGSTSRHKFAFLYSKNDKIFINLNLQIRFIK